MHSLNLRMAMFFAVVLGIAGLCVLSVNYQVKRDDVKRQPPPLDHNVAEGFRLWNPKAGVDSVRFESCRVEKRLKPVPALVWNGGERRLDDLLK